MARVVRFLVTEGTYITGQVIQVDGGKAVGLNPYQAG
jgi:NAD(P)-dependent dehydrogenase (short-subunit alcohol dehydrogenase family)